MSGELHRLDPRSPQGLFRGDRPRHRGAALHDLTRTTSVTESSGHATVDRARRLELNQQAAEIEVFSRSNARARFLTVLDEPTQSSLGVCSDQIPKTKNCLVSVWRTDLLAGLSLGLRTYMSISGQF